MTRVRKELRLPRQAVASPAAQEGGAARTEPTVGKLRPAEILESISDAFVTVDRDWRFSYANPKAELVFRMKRERLIGQRCWDLFPEGVRTQGRRRLEEAMAEGRSVHYLEYSLRYGIWFEVTAYPYVDGLSIYFRDVTERVAAEQKLRLHERAIEASVNAIVITTGRRQRYSIVHVNPAFERITGYSAAEVTGKNCSFLQREDWDQPELGALRALINEQKEGRVTLRNYRKDGSLFYNELHLAPVRTPKGDVTHFVGVLNDITETKRYQNELERHINHDALTGPCQSAPPAGPFGAGHPPGPAPRNQLRRHIHRSRPLQARQRRARASLGRSPAEERVSRAPERRQTGGHRREIRRRRIRGDRE